jgi:hypothetical protein
VCVQVVLCIILLIYHTRDVKLEDCEEKMFAQPIAVLKKRVPTDDFPSFPLTTIQSESEPHPILAYKIRKLDAEAEGKENKGGATLKRKRAE